MNRTSLSGFNQVTPRPLFLMIMTKRLSSFLSAFLIVVFVATSATAAIPPAEKLLPPDTLVVVTVPDFVKLRAAYDKSAQSRFLNDPAMKPFREKFLSKWNEEFITPLERDLGIKLDDYSALPQGQVTLALTLNGWTANSNDDTEPAFVLLLDAKDKSDQLKKALDDLRKKWTDSGRNIKAEKIRDVEFSIVSLSSNDIPKSLKSFFPQRQEIHELGKDEPKKVEQNSQLILGQFESLLIAGNSVKVMESVVARLTGGNAPSLADEAMFEENRLALFRDAGFFAWFNAKSFFDALLKLPKEKPNPQAPNPRPMPDLDKIITGLGFAGLKTVSLTFHDAGEGSTFELYFGAPESTRQGLFKLVAAAAKDSGPPPFVPADVVRFYRVRLEGPKTIATIEKSLKDISPQLFNTWDFLIKSGEEMMKQSDPSYDIRKSIFANLGDDIIVYEKAPRGTSLADLDSPPSLYAVASPNAEQLARSLSGLFIIRSSDALTPKTREFLGKKIYSIGSSAGMKFSYAASGSYVVFSSDPSMLEEFLRSAESPGKSLRETPGLTDAAQKVGGLSTGLFSYENQNESVRVAFEMFKKLPNGGAPGGSNPLTAAIPFAGPERSFREWFDFSLLPTYSSVSKYFYFSVWSGSATTDGLSYKYFSPTPPGLK